ncbi:MAG: hypothetical protein J0I69_02745 [Altererythrobacter sp.]|nr:hypothetical protein [Altererythrobacter sp.]
MTRTKPAAPPARPTGGGSFIRDRKTGELTRVQAKPEPAPAPANKEEA